MKEVNREIDNAFNGFINKKLNSENDKISIGDINNLREKIKYDIDLSVGDLLDHSDRFWFRKSK